MGTGRLKALGQISHCYEAVESDSGPYLRGEVRDRRGSRNKKKGGKKTIVIFCLLSLV